MRDYSSVIKQLQDAGCTCKTEEPMSAHTSFNIGGPADLFVCVGNAESLKAALNILNANSVPVFLLGNGSNLLVSDMGIEGAVLKLVGDFCTCKMISNNEIECGAGVKLAALCSFALEKSLSGMEFAWGIPGTVGGAAYMNAGAYDSVMSNVVVACRHIDLQGNEGEYSVNDLGYDYRISRYMNENKIITSVVLKLGKGEPESIKARMDELMGLRKSKQPLEYPSAGSVFKRPAGYYAGALVDECGLRGKRIGGAMVSEKHAGFIINMGSATCNDVCRLIKEIQDEVFLKTGVKLETEVKAIGRL